ncbi:MAG: Chromosomal replication initiator protein DnaA [Phycisphaerae bacterium]|nr:Chromosomal replication initiator protein DnaA [Phycisphaerae bacterium]
MTTLTTTEWSGILNYVRQHHANITRHWFDQLRFIGLQHGTVDIRCANLPQQRYLSEQCARQFTEAAQVETGQLVSVRFTVEDDSSGNQTVPAPDVDLPLFANEPRQILLNPEYTFDQFVTGPSNRLAHAASVAVSDSPGETYNPLFIHGSVGLGKTHLLQAVCHHILSHRPTLNVLYLSCESFINHFLEAVERGALHQFRYRYRHVDLLVIDDIQFLAERERSQEEFFHTFNTLYQSRKQIILSADCPPREIPSLEDRLVSRFNWGLVTRIDPPCLETRMAILRKKARRRNLDFPEDVIRFIATRIDSNARELEGAINAVDVFSQQLGQPVDLSSAKEALGDVSTVSRPIAISLILDVVAEHFNVKKSDIQGKRRHKSIAFPRQVAMYLTREVTSHSLEEIGSFFGGRDHTTVLHANRLIGRLRQEDNYLSATLDQLKSRISNGSPVDRG